MHGLFWSDSGDWLETSELSLIQKMLLAGTHRAWIDAPVPTEETLAELGKLFNLHPLTIRAILERIDDPRIDVHESYIFLVLHRVFYDFQTEDCELREFEVCFSDRFLITTHTKQLSRTFATAQEKVLEHKRDWIQHGTSYVLYRILNLSIQDYSPAIEEWQEALDDIEQAVLQKTRNNVLEEILNFKKLVARMRKRLLPEREVLRELYENRALPFFSPLMRPYFKTIVDNLNAVFLDLESLRDHATSVFEVYSTTLSHHLNFVMQRLTIAATIFLPLTFIVGVYGMNFDYFPELHWKGSYFVVWGAMLTLVASMAYFFKKRKWL